MRETAGLADVPHRIGCSLSSRFAEAQPGQETAGASTTGALTTISCACGNPVRWQMGGV